MARPLTAAIADGWSAVTDIGNRKPDGACCTIDPARVMRIMPIVTLRPAVPTPPASRAAASAP